MPKSERQPFHQRFNIAFKTAAAYATLGTLWILLSDRLVNLLAGDPQTAARWQTIKGWGYIVITALLLYTVLQPYIARQNRARRALRDSETRYRTLVEQSEDGIYLLYDRKFAFINQGFEALFGVTSEQVRAPDFDFTDLVAPESHSLIEERQRKLAAGEEVSPRYEFTALNAQGDKIRVEVSVSYLPYRDGLATQGVVRDVTERRQAEEALRQRTNQLEVLHDISLAITAHLDFDDLLQDLLEQACRLFDVQGASLYLVDPKRGDLKLVAIRGFEGDHTGARLSPGEGLAGKVLETGRPLCVADYSRWEGRSPAWDGQRITASLAVPLKRGGRVIGTLGFGEIGKPHTFDEQDVWLATLLASQTAIAIENARLYEETAQRAMELTVLYDVASAAMTSAGLDDILDHTLNALEETLRPDAASILLIEGPDELSIRASTGFPDGAELVRGPFGVGIPGSVVATGEPVLLADVRQDERYHPCDPQTRSELCVPLWVGDQVIGALNLESHRLAAFDEEDLRVLSILASGLAAMIENARLFEHARQEIAERRRVEKELRDRERFLTLLNDVTRAALETSDLPAMLQILVGRLGDLFEADGCYLTMWDPVTETVTPVAAYGASRDSYRSLSSRSAEGTMTGAVLRAGHAIAVEDVLDTPVIDRRTAEFFPERSILGLPLIAGDEKLGAALIAFADPYPFSQKEIARGEQAARQMALAVSKAQLVAELRQYTDELEGRVAERTAQVREQVAQMEAILNSVADGIVVTGSEGDIVRANPVAYAWLHHALAPEEAQDLREMITAMTRRATARPVQLLQLKRMDLQLTAAPIADIDPDQTRAVVAIHDVTHLRALDRMRTRFITNISHELKTPVATIKILAHLMGKQPDAWQEHWQLLSEETESLASLVESILDIARLDAGRLDMTFEPIELNTFTERVVGNYETLSREHGLTLVWRPSAGDRMVTADPQYMMGILDNLLTNAIQYTPEGGQVTIAIDEAQQDLEAPQLRSMGGGRRWTTVTVTDTGWGIPEDEQEYVFQRFFRGEKARAMQISGTGLGLALTKEIVELHGGKITMESQVDQGSTFTIWLPTAD